MDEFLTQLRNDHEDFDQGKLDDEIKKVNPTQLFQKWYKEAFERNCAEPHAMVISTCVNNRPSSRTVYMKELVEEGLIFYTNYESRKGKEIDQNPNVSVIFYWDCLERQVRIEGKAIKAPSEMSDDYFASRPRKSQLGAWASRQSESIAERSELEKAVEEIENRFKGVVKIPRPDFWGGYLIQPIYFEFWQGRPGRLHDRICFSKTENKWNTSRINP